MYYIVFSSNRDSDGVVIGTVHYKGVSKSSAIEAFTTVMPSSFSITALSGTLNLVGFEYDLKSFIEELEKPTISDRDCINIILRNMGLATCSNILSTSGYKSKTLVHECSECDTTNIAVQKNIYGNYLCSKCWTKYWTSRESLAEYLIGLANGTYKVYSFSNADKATIVDAWQNAELDTEGKEKKKSNRDLLKDAGWSEEALAALEQTSGLF